MSSQSVAASKFQSEVIRRSDSATNKLLRLWNRVSVNDLDAGWLSIAPELNATVAAVVVQNAASSARMVSTTSRADRIPSGDRIVPNAFIGVDSTGRSSEGLLHGAVTTTKEGIRAGSAAPLAFMAGASYLAAMSKTLFADMARSSAAVSSAGRGYTRYVRVVNPGACSRCAILAGSDRFSKPFERHPACRCTSVPVREGESVPDGLYASPDEHFWSLSEAEQDRIYGKAGAEAIRMGADPIQVVGARRGASGMSYSRSRPSLPWQQKRMQRVPIGVAPDGTPIMGYTTIEGTTRRGRYGRNNLGRVRLMPETIFELTNDPDMRRTLLRDAGYLEIPIGDRSSNSWIGARIEQQRLDRIAADTFYRSLGIDLY